MDLSMYELKAREPKKFMQLRFLENLSVNKTDSKIAAPADVIDSQKVRVKNDGTLTGIRFELEPEAVGRRRLAIRIVAPEADNNEEDELCKVFNDKA